MLAYTPERRDKADRETVLVRLSPRALHELYVETKDCSPAARQAGHTIECDRCGDSVPLEKATLNKHEASPCTVGVMSTPTADQSG